MGDESRFQAIADILNHVAPEGWRKVWVTTTFGEASGESLFDFVNAAGTENWFAPGIDAQVEIYEALKSIRAQMLEAGRARWSRVRVELENSGKLHVEFGY